MELKRIEYLGLERVIKRGSGEIVAERDDALFVRDAVSGSYLLACEDAALGIKTLDAHIGADCDLLMISNHALALEAFERYGFTQKLECFQVAYYGKKPALDGRLSVRTAGESDLSMLAENYHLIGEDELRKVVERRAVLIGYCDGEPVGFIGEHLEGSMGMLFVFPEHRRRGFGEALQRAMIADTMERGFVPFGQVVKDNAASLALQGKLGMKRSEGLIVWMWK